MPSKTPKKVKAQQTNAKAFAASRGSTSLVFSSLARKVKFALERGELGVSDPEDTWSKAYFLNRAETDHGATCSRYMLKIQAAIAHHTCSLYIFAYE